ncbi:hypothetical protein KRR40_09050 [Niabella defluvii]|nr:hypothetical protein KRR40_09050 [Niabella sp. I65]
MRKKSNSFYSGAGEQGARAGRGECEEPGNGSAATGEF